MSNKIGNIFNSYHAEVEKLDEQWFEWRGRLVLSAADVDVFLRKNAIFVRTLKSFVRPGRRPHIRRELQLPHALQAPNSKRLVVCYPVFRCSSCG